MYSCISNIRKSAKLQPPETDQLEHRQVAGRVRHRDNKSKVFTNKNENENKKLLLLLLVARNNDRLLLLIST